MAVTALLGLPIPQMGDRVGDTIPDLASAMQIIDEKLGGSRIVDHNLDVANPPNGYYMRGEDGWQVCWRRRTAKSFDPAVTNRGISWAHQSEYWDYPAAFAISPTAILNADLGTPRIEAHKAYTVGPTRCTLYFGVDNYSSLPSAIYSDGVLAIGSWK